MGSRAPPSADDVRAAARLWLSRDDPPAEPEVDPALPTAFVATRPKKRPDDDDDAPPFTFERLKGRLVDVRAGGFDYRGTLIGADENEIYLRAETRWVVLPLDRVTRVVAAAKPPRPSAGTPPGFGQPDDEPGA